MRKDIIKAGLAGAAVLAMGVSAPAMAATTISGAVTSISANSSDPGLVVFTSPIAFADITLNAVGDTAVREVFNIGTNESIVNLDDLVPSLLSATFTFTNPTGTSGTPVVGVTGGFYAGGLFGSCGLFAGGCGGATDFIPTVFDFDGGGQFSVQLLPTTFGTPGNANVSAQFELLTAPVPEPTTWAMMIIGFALVGGVMRRRKTKTNVSVSYA